jgi:hypothetical protein
MTTPNDGAEPSLASAGSQPVAIMSWEQADKIIQDQRAEIARLRLTDEERCVIWTVAEAYAENDGDPECERIARIMQGLWQRTK